MAGSFDVQEVTGSSPAVSAKKDLISQEIRSVLAFIACFLTFGAAVISGFIEAGSYSLPPAAACWELCCCVDFAEFE